MFANLFNKKTTESETNAVPNAAEETYAKFLEEFDAFDGATKKRLTRNSKSDVSDITFAGTIIGEGMALTTLGATLGVIEYKDNNSVSPTAIAVTGAGVAGIIGGNILKSKAATRLGRREYADFNFALSSGVELMKVKMKSAMDDVVANARAEAEKAEKAKEPAQAEAPATAPDLKPITADPFASSADTEEIGRAHV